MGFGNAPSRDNAQGIPTFLGLSGRPLSLLVSIVATNGFLLFGYDQGVMSGIISAPDFNNAFPETRGDSTWQGFVTAIYEVRFPPTFRARVEGPGQLTTALPRLDASSALFSS
jgi:hypothetical protein